MKKLKKFLFLYFSFLFVAAIFSCKCSGPTSAEIIGNGNSDITNLDLSAGPITGPFIITHSPEIEYTDNTPSFNLLNSAYATSCDVEFINFLESDKLTLTFDKSINFKGEEVAAGTNILDFDDFNLSSRMEESAIILFTTEILSNFEFQKTTYFATIQMETSNGLMLESSTSKEFDIN